MSLFGKPLDQIVPEDLEWLLNEQIPEGDDVEFKRELPAKEPGKIGDRARNEILEEVVGFANAHGGHVIIGIEESEDKPHRATKIVPLPGCAEIADRIRLQARDCIDPQLPVLSSVGVGTDGQGGGVIVIRVPESRLAPHRLKPTKECYIRRADRTEKMTMREIQDLTLNRHRGMEAVETRFAELQRRFVKRFSDIEARGAERPIGLRVSAVAMSPVHVDRVWQNQVVRPEDRKWRALIGKGQCTLEDLQCSRERPVLRGVQFFSDLGHYLSSQEVFSDGALSSEIIFGVEKPFGDGLLAKWILGVFVNTALSAHKFRVAAGAPGAEYALELEIRRPSGKVGLFGFGQGNSAIGEFDGNLEFPRYSVGAPEEFDQLFSLVLQDLWHSAGVDFDTTRHAFRVDCEDFLKTVGSS